MKLYYEAIFQIEFFHSFYADQISRAFSFDPSPSCRKLLEYYRLLFKPRENGFGVIGEKKNTGTDAAPVLEPIVEIPADTKFYFFIRPTRNDILNITDADMDALAEGKKFLLRNRLSTPFVINGSVVTFTIHNNVPLTEALTIGSVDFLAPINIPENPGRLKLIDANGSMFTEKVVPRNSLNEITTDHMLLSASPLPEGLYDLQQIDNTNTVTSTQRFFLTDPASARQVCGVLLIDYNHFMVAHSDKETHLEARLANRSMNWIYNLEIERYLDPTEAPFTFDPNLLFLNNNANNVPSVGTSFQKTIIFAPSPQENDKVTWRSNNPIKIREEPYRDVRLIDTGMPDPVIDHMPNPDPLKMKEDGGGGYEIEIFSRIK